MDIVEHIIHLHLIFPMFEMIRLIDYSYHIQRNGRWEYIVDIVLKVRYLTALIDSRRYSMT